MNPIKKWAPKVRAALSPFVESIATHEVIGRGTIKVVFFKDGPFNAGTIRVIDEEFYWIDGIEMSHPRGDRIGLQVRPCA